MKQLAPQPFTPCFLKRAVVALALLAGLTLAAPAQLLYQWNFDTAVSGTTVTPNVAVGGGGGLTMNYNAVPTDMYTPNGGGVSGGYFANDRAFANNNTTYGNGAASGLVRSTVGDMNIGPLGAFTMTGWIKPDGGYNAINGGGGATTTFQRVFLIGQGTPDTGAANAATLALYNNGAGGAFQTNALQLRLSNILGPSGTDGGLSGNGSLNDFNTEWTFFAVTVDLTLSANNVNFYFGSPTSLNSPITVSYNNAGAPIGSIDFGATATALFLNRDNRQRGLDGLGDDFRFYNGVLDAAAVESARVSAVPEPGTAALVGLGCLVGLTALRHRRNQG